MCSLGTHRPTNALSASSHCSPSASCKNASRSMLASRRCSGPDPLGTATASSPASIIAALAIWAHTHSIHVVDCVIACTLVAAHERLVVAHLARVIQQGAVCCDSLVDQFQRAFIHVGCQCVAACLSNWCTPRLVSKIDDRCGTQQHVPVLDTNSLNLRTRHCGDGTV